MNGGGGEDQEEEPEEEEIIETEEDEDQPSVVVKKAATPVVADEKQQSTLASLRKRFIGEKLLLCLLKHSSVNLPPLIRFCVKERRRCYSCPVRGGLFLSAHTTYIGED